MEGKAKVTIPNASTVATIDFDLANVEDGFTGVCRFINNDTVTHTVNLATPAAGLFLQQNLTTVFDIPAGQMLELTLAYDGLKTAVTGGLFI